VTTLTTEDRAPGSSAFDLGPWTQEIGADLRTAATKHKTPPERDRSGAARTGLVDKARADGVEVVGPDGMMTGLTKSVQETALEAEMTAMTALTFSLAR
jgi:hypothetical protein